MPPTGQVSATLCSSRTEESLNYHHQRQRNEFACKSQDDLQWKLQFFKRLESWFID
eukprot:m.286402 g.286402  ORF g.286402 m.286402 type:complete len:56 (+) comp16208_c0_seq3:523-690(+)